MVQNSIKDAGHARTIANGILTVRLADRCSRKIQKHDIDWLELSQANLPDDKAKILKDVLPQMKQVKLEYENLNTKKYKVNSIKTLVENVKPEQIDTMQVHALTDHGKSIIDFIELHSVHLKEIDDQFVYINSKNKKGMSIDELIEHYKWTMQYKDLIIERIDEKYFKFGTRKIMPKLVNDQLLIKVGGGCHEWSKFYELNAEQELAK